jgi:fructokinase
MEASLPRLVVFGEALTDFVRSGDNSWHSIAGGSCWNVARVAATLGVASAWAGAVSDDLFGHDIIGHSRVAGLDLRFAQVVAKPPLIAMVHQTHPPQYFFLGSDTADLAFDETLLPAGWEAHCEFAHFGCISLVRQPLGSRLLAIAERLKARGVRISFDPNYRNLMGPDYPALFERLAAIADIIKISDEDMGQIYPQLGADAALSRIRALAPQAMLLYTRGADGLTLYRHDEAIEQSAFKVEVADTVGAGDSCIGGFIASLLSSPQASNAEHLRFAAAAAAVVCSHAGAYSPQRNEVDHLLA